MSKLIQIKPEQPINRLCNQNSRPQNKGRWKEKCKKKPVPRGPDPQFLPNQRHNLKKLSGNQGRPPEQQI